MSNEHSAVVTSIKVSPHPNADRVQLAHTKFGNYQIVVGLDQKDGELGIFFQPDLQLSEEFAAANDLVGYRDENGEKKGGYFSKNRRVRIQKFRGERSEGFWIPVSSLEKLSPLGTYESLKDGDIINEIGDTPICNKYYTPATIKAQKGGTSRLRRKNLFFHKHKSTAQFRDEGRAIPKGSLITISEKCHGTSQRVGKVLDNVEVMLPFHKKLWRRITNKPAFEQTVIIGSRNVLLKDPKALKDSFYGSEEFRYKHAERFQHLLRENEIVYYELTGYTHTNQEIMNSSDLTTDKDLKGLKKIYGPRMTFAYSNPVGQCTGYVYRITNISPEGDEYDLSDAQMRQRCTELGLEAVEKVMDSFIYDGDLEKLTKLLVNDEVLEVPSVHDSRHIREGIALRIDNESGTSFMKIKSFSFCTIEGIQKSFIGYEDMEEIS